MDPNSENHSEYSANESRQDSNLNYSTQPNFDYHKFYMGGVETQYTQRSNVPFYLPTQMNNPYQSNIYPNSNFQMNTLPQQTPNYGMDKPWTRAMKDPSLIQRGTEIFVGNLSMDTFENDIFEAFRDCGEVIDVKNY